MMPDPNCSKCKSRYWEPKSSDSDELVQKATGAIETVENGEVLRQKCECLIDIGEMAAGVDESLNMPKGYVIDCLSDHADTGSPFLAFRPKGLHLASTFFCNSPVPLAQFQLFHSRSRLAARAKLPTPRPR
jgi:hypothetical protein